jgi:hypothetical protein
MSELSPRGQALLHASRAALRPDVTDRERILVGLRERLGTAALAGTGKVAAATQTSHALWALGAAALLGVGGAVGVALTSDADRATRAAPPVLVSVAPSAALLTPPASFALPAVVPAPASSAGATTGSISGKRADRLAEEVAILSQAAKDLRAGRAAEALGALNEHHRKFPSGLLTQERRAARAEALCSLGRFGEAQAELSILSRSTAESPLLVRARERCQARSSKTHP